MRRFLTALTSLLAVTLLAFPAHAVSLIRDAEIEHYLRDLSDPVFKAAGLTPENVRIFIVNNDAINAYVAGGSNIFINTGLLKEMENPGMLIGVIAHETGHISGSHLARGSEKLRGAQLGMILGYVLGAAAVAAGGGDAGMAVMAGSQNIVQRNILSFSRANEQAADQAAVTTLDKLGISASGMMGTFNVLRRHEQMRVSSIPDPYLMTHPLSRERIEFVRNHLEKSSIPEGQHPRNLDVPHQRMRAKLYAYLELPPRTFARYPAADKSIPARLARAVAWYKIPELTKALAEVDSLIAEKPKDPFLYDLKGQILFENGRIPEAKTTYEKAVALLPDSALLLSSLAETRIATNTAVEIRKAAEELDRSTRIDNSHAKTWHLIATAQGKLGNSGTAHLALAEEAALTNDADSITREAELALKALPAGSPGTLRAEDLKRLAKEMKEAQDD